MQFCLLFVIFGVNANSYTEVAYLGDICSPPYIPCVTPNSQCIHTDNIFYDRQSFCICLPGFEPSTGHCINDDDYSTTTTSPSTTTAPKVANDATNSSDVDNSTIIEDTTQLMEQPASPTRRPQTVRRPSGLWPSKTGKFSKLPPNNPIYEPPFPALTTSSSIRRIDDNDDQNFQAQYSTTRDFLHLRLNPYPNSKGERMKMVAEKPIVQEEQKALSAPKNPSRDISPELLAAVTSMSQMYDLRTITESPYNMKLPQQAGLFHNDIKPIPYHVTTVEPSNLTKNDEVGLPPNTRSYVPLDILLNNNKQKLDTSTKSQIRSSNSESRSQLTKFYKNRYPNAAAVSRLAMDPVNRGIDSIIRSTTPKIGITTIETLIHRTNIYHMIENPAPDIFNFVKSKIGFTMINTPFLTTTASAVPRMMADNKIDSTSKRNKESSSEILVIRTTHKPKPLLLKIVSSNSTNVMKKPRIIFNG